MQEIIKPVLGYECYYGISNLGNLYRVNEERKFINNKIEFYPIYNEMKLSERPDGYLQVNLCTDSIQKRKLVHRLVAEAFIPNPNNYPQVNHKDGDRQNNNDWNLEWCNNSMNQLHLIHVLGTHNNFGKRNGECAKALKIDQLDIKTGEVIKTWTSIKEPIQKGIASSMVWRALQDSTKTCKGYKWRYNNSM